MSEFRRGIARSPTSSLSSRKRDDGKAASVTIDQRTLSVCMINPRQCGLIRMNALA